MSLCFTSIGEKPQEAVSKSGEVGIQAVMVILKTVGPCRCG